MRAARKSRTRTNSRGHVRARCSRVTHRPSADLVERNIGVVKDKQNQWLVDSFLFSWSKSEGHLGGSPRKTVARVQVQDESLAPRSPFETIAIRQSKFFLQRRQPSQQLALVLETRMVCVFRTRVLREFRVKGALIGGDSQGIKFRAEQEMAAGDISRALAELVGGHVALEVLAEEALHQSSGAVSTSLGREPCEYDCSSDRRPCNAKHRFAHQSASVSVPSLCPASRRSRESVVHPRGRQRLAQRSRAARMRRSATIVTVRAGISSWKC